MTRTRKVTIPIEVTIYEPEDLGEGRFSIPMFMMMAGGSYTFRGETLGVGDALGSLVAYLPGNRAIGVPYKALINAALNHLGLASEMGLPEAVA
jgi:hypothetical protein